MSYSWLAEPLVDREGYELVAYRESDMMTIKRWRNEQMRVLRQQHALSASQQIAYYRDVIFPSMHAEKPTLILVSFLKDGQCIGYGGLTNIEWQVARAEVSFLLATEQVADLPLYSRRFGVFLSLLKALAFRRVGLRRLFTETYDIRPQHVAALEAAGFRLEGRLRQHQVIDGVRTDVLFHGILREDHSC